MGDTMVVAGHHHPDCDRGLCARGCRIGETPCGVTTLVLGIFTPVVCDRAKGHAGHHRAYMEQVDDVVFWANADGGGTSVNVNATAAPAP